MSEFIVYSAGFKEQPGMPVEVLEVVREAKRQMLERLTVEEFRIVAANYWFSYNESEYSPKREWRLGSNFEDGISTAIFDVDSKIWYYREPWEGRDTLVKGGVAEVVAHLRAFFVDI